MDLGCIAPVGILLLVLGGAILIFERIRSRRANTPYPYPDMTTALMEGFDDPDATPVRPRPPFQEAETTPDAPAQKASSLVSRLKQLGAATGTLLGSAGASPAISANKRTKRTGRPLSRGVIALVGVALLAFSLTLIFTFATGPASQKDVPKGVIVVIAAFAGDAPD